MSQHFQRAIGAHIVFCGQAPGHLVHLFTHSTCHQRDVAGVQRHVAGARGDEVDWVARQLVQAHDVRTDRAVELLKEKRGE